MAEAAARPPERDIYRTLWAGRDYRNCSPGEWFARPFIENVRPEPGATLIDFGCGTGRAGLALSRAGMDVTLVDFAENCLDAEVRAEGLRFVEADLAQPLTLRAKYGYCADVMEHIAPADVDAVLANVLACVDYCFFLICTVPDRFGATVGHALHLTVRPAHWWRAKLSALRTITFEGNTGTNCMFCVSRG